MSDDQGQPPPPATMTRRHLAQCLLDARLLDALTATATPIDFADLERRGVLQKVKHDRGWYLKRRYGVTPRLTDRLAAAAELADRLHGRAIQTIDVEAPAGPIFAVACLPSMSPDPALGRNTPTVDAMTGDR
jgi:hypothetical protein